MGFNEIAPFDDPLPEIIEEEPDCDDIETEEDEYDEPTDEEPDPFEELHQGLRLNLIWLWDGECLLWCGRRLPRKKPLFWEKLRLAVETLLKRLPEVDPIFCDFQALQGLAQSTWIDGLTDNRSGSANLEGQAMTDLDGHLFPLARLLADQGNAEGELPKYLKTAWLEETIRKRLGLDALASVSWRQVKTWLPEAVENFCRDLGRITAEAFPLKETVIPFQQPQESTLQRKWLAELRADNRPTKRKEPLQ